MNLIEEYGSYESAMDGLRVLESSPYAVDQAYAYELKNNMLEYRRQHNIFEVGDKVVYLSSIAPDHNDIYELSKIGKMYHVLKIGVMDYNAKCNHIRHAADAEIKAGKRRPELDSDTCSDIRNHISPLTKVIDR